MQSLSTEAWLLQGISSIPGKLVLRHNRLSFQATGSGSTWPRQLRKLEQQFAADGFVDAIGVGSSPELFQWQLSDFKYWIPWYYFGGGIKISHSSTTLSFSFGRPANTYATPYDSTVRSLKDISVMRNKGKLWMETLAKAKASIEVEN